MGRIRFTPGMADPCGKALATFRIFPLSLLLLFSPACSSLQSNASRSTESLPQASGTMTGTGHLAASAFRATALAALRQPGTTLRTGLAVLWHRPQEVVTGNLPVEEIVAAPLPEEAPGTPEFEALLDRKGMPRRSSGSVSWLVDGPGFFTELDRQLAAARHSIDLQFFIYDNADVAVRYSDELKRRAEDVPVRVLFDDLGSTFAHTAAPETPGPRGFMPPPDIARYLKAESKVRVRRSLNPWPVCDHTKLLVFDQYYSEWHDLMVKAEGPVVGSLAREFNRAWRKAGPFGDFALFQSPRSVRTPEPRPGDIPLRLLRTDSAKGQTHDTLSLRINRELNLAFSDPEAIRELERQVFLPDFRSSRLFRLEETGRLGAPLAETIADQL